VRRGEAAADFCISGPADHGVAGVVNLFGMESPGLTASLALADRIASIACGDTTSSARADEGCETLRVDGGTIKSAF
jgi:L-2-hydroxyglutarate oxidase LhgO